MKINFPLCEVEWLDACSEEAHLEIDVAKLVTPLTRWNVGYCLLRNRAGIVLGFGLIENMFKGKAACNITMAIPKGCIKAIRYLREGGK